MPRRDALFTISLWRIRRAATRRVVMLAVTAIAASMMGMLPASAQCVTGTTAIECSGDLSGGVAVSGGGIDTLNVDNVTTNIAPPAGTAGIFFQRTGTVYLNAQILQSAIATSGVGADGVHVEGEAVQAFVFGDVTTQGDNSSGILIAATDGVFVQTSGNILTSGLQSNGIDVSGEGPVTVVAEGNVTVQGISSTAIHATTSVGSLSVSSIGNIVASGDFGVGIDAQGVSGAVVTSIGDISAAQLGIGAQTFATSGPPSGSVSIVSTGNITTGEVGTGIQAYSEGSSVDVLSVGNIVAGTLAGIGIGIEAEGGGGSATVTSFGDIVVSGDNAVGIGAVAHAGAAEIVTIGNILAVGDNAVALGVEATGGNAMIQSAGNTTAIGDGSVALRATANGGSVTVAFIGNVTAIGANAVAIYASGSGGVWINIEAGNVVGGSAGVQMDGGPSQLENYGSISALSGPAIITDLAHADIIDNYGTITGNVGVGAGDADDFNNHEGALFNSGAVAYIGGTLTNRGTLAPGGQGAVLLTSLEGALVQERMGTYAVDIAGTASDRLVITGAAQLAGIVDVNVMSLPSSTTTYTILAADSVVDNGLRLSASPALHAQLLFPQTGPDIVQLGIAVDFRADGLSRNATAVAGSLNGALGLGGGSVTPLLLGLLNTHGIEDYKAALDQVMPSVYQSSQIAAYYANAAFSNALLSCRVNGPDTASIVREGQCLWAGATAQFLNSAGTFEQPGFNQTAGVFAAGAQVALDEVWRLGFAAGYQNTSLDMPTGAASDGDQAQIGAALKYNPGPLLLAGALTGGVTWNETKRPMAFGGFNEVAGGSQRIDIFSASARAAYAFGAPSLYLKPLLDGSVTLLDAGDFVEAGGNGGALAIQGSRQAVWAITPAVEMGTEWWLGNGTLVRPFVRGGATWNSGGDISLAASFAAAPDGVGPFTITSNMDDLMGVVGAGVDVINAGDAALRITYDRQFGDTTEIHSVSFKGSARF